MYRSCIVLFTILASSNAFSVPPAFRVSNLSRCVFPRIIDFYFRELTFPLFCSLLLPHLPWRLPWRPTNWKPLLTGGKFARKENVLSQMSTISSLSSKSSSTIFMRGLTKWMIWSLHWKFSTLLTTETTMKFAKLCELSSACSLWEQRLVETITSQLGWPLVILAKLAVDPQTRTRHWILNLGRKNPNSTGRIHKEPHSSVMTLRDEYFSSYFS